MLPLDGYVRSCKETCMEIGQMAFVRAPNRPYLAKFGLLLFVLAWIMVALCVRFSWRPYVYEHEIKSLHLIVGVLPSFISVVVCYYAIQLYLATKNLRPNSTNHSATLLLVVISNILHEVFLTSVYDVCDIMAILSAGLFVDRLELVFKYLKINLEIIYESNRDYTI